MPSPSIARLSALAALLALGACQTAGSGSGPIASSLPANAMACRSQASVATLDASGAEFQRTADAELASGRCRVFQKGHGVLDHQTGASARFVDPASGQTFWIYRH